MMGNTGTEVRPYDIFYESKWLFLVVGFADSNSPVYTAFKVALFAFYFYVFWMSFYAMYLLVPNMNLVIDAFHVFLAAIWLTWCLGTRVYTDRWLKEMRSTINAGIYFYKKESVNEEQLAMQRGIKEDIQRKSKMIMIIYLSGFMSVMFFFPYTEYLLSKGKAEDGEHIANPYLPHVYYFPFDTRTPAGYFQAYLMDFVLWLVTYITAVTTNGIVISSTVQLKVELQVLNYSLLNIEKRAQLLYRKKRTLSHEKATLSDLLNDEEFHRCLNYCLKANVEHHQALLRFKKICHPFNGSGILNVFTIGTVIYATTLYLLFQNLPMNVLVKYAGTFLAEQAFSYFICHFGEEVKEESRNLFSALYNNPWHSYSKGFKQTLHIMMSNTLKPITIDAHLLNFSASLESYGELLAAVYKVMNIWRQSNKIS